VPTSNYIIFNKARLTSERNAISDAVVGHTTGTDVIVGDCGVSTASYI
jgi:hypothetical protein